MAQSAKERFLKEYSASLLDDIGTVFVGAGVSMAAGYPSWTALLREIGDELGVKSTDVYDLAALAQWSVHSAGGYSRIRQVIRDNIAKELALPETVRIIARLPLRYIWTTNYDRLLERAFSEINRPLDAISAAGDLSLKPQPGAVRLYKMHGSIDRLDDLVISTDDYELFRSKRGAYLPLLQAHLTGMSMLFVGLSFADPNIKHVLSLIRESFTDAPPEHFAIVRPPQRKDFKSKSEFSARATQHALWAKDLRRYGLIAVEIDNYDEVPELLRLVERRVAQRRVWISGSWPLHAGANDASKVYEIAAGIGRHVGEIGLSLVTGNGLLVGSAAIAGFLDSLRRDGGWDLDRRLIARPFPQPIAGQPPDLEQWTQLRKELARLAGIVIFVGGEKMLQDKTAIADGVMQEFSFAKASGAFLLPIGATGGAARKIAAKLMGSPLPCKGSGMVRPTDAELQRLCDVSLDAKKLVSVACGVLKRAQKG